MAFLGNQPNFSTMRQVVEGIAYQGQTEIPVPGGFTPGMGMVDVVVGGSDLGTADYDDSNGLSIKLYVPMQAGTNFKIVAWTPNQTVTSTGGLLYGFRNKIINGDMRIDQRNVGNSGADSSGFSPYGTDRWRVITRTGATITHQQGINNNVAVPSRWSQTVTITSAKASPAGTDQFRVATCVEGSNWAEMQYGSANAQTCTLSFWSGHSTTGVHSGSVFNKDANRSYVFTYTQNVANTWEKKVVTFVGDTSGTWYTDTNVGIVVSFDYGSGTTMETSTPNAWLTGTYLRTAGSQAPVKTTGAAFRISTVQLEKGSIATDFEFRPITTEINLCQRYYEKSYQQNLIPGNYAAGCRYGFFLGSANISSNGRLPVRFTIEKVGVPTVRVFPDNGGSAGTSNNSSGSPYAVLVPNIGTTGFEWANNAGGGAAMDGAFFNWDANAEII